jgi:CO dehydrogenase/acetyl-CoA synthase epsilon subunit
MKQNVYSLAEDARKGRYDIVIMLGQVRVVHNRAAQPFRSVTTPPDRQG